MTPKDADWFRRCAVEIEEHDGHLIMERFLRLYQALYGDSDILGVRVHT
jgi:hypothetical protein